MAWHVARKAISHWSLVTGHWSLVSELSEVSEVSEVNTRRKKIDRRGLIHQTQKENHQWQSLIARRNTKAPLPFFPPTCEEVWEQVGMKMNFIKRNRGARLFRDKYGRVTDIIDIYFINNGKEHFLTSIPESPGKSGNYNLMMYMNQVELTRGKYINFNCEAWNPSGRYRIRNPLRFFQWVENNRFSVDRVRIAKLNLPGEPWDIQGVLKEITAGFYFRIWDHEFAGKVIKKLNLLLEEQKSRVKG